MNNTRKSIFRIVIALITISLIGMLIKVENSNYQKYELKKLLEKPITTDYKDSSLYLLHSRAKYKENYILIINTEFFLAPQIPAPGLIGIDNEGNIYISNASENLKVFDKEGKFLYNFNYPDRCYGIFSPFDNQNNIYIFLEEWDHDPMKSIVYKINAINKTQEILSKNAINQLDPMLLPPKNSAEVISRKNFNQGKNGVYYDIIDGQRKIKSIFLQPDGRFVSPENLIIYKQDVPFDTVNVPISPDKYRFAVLDIQNLCEDKVVYISSYQIDAEGNVYVSGVRSNDTERTKISVEGSDKIAVKIFNPIFFIWKFEKKED